LLALIALIVVLAAVGLSYRGWRQHQADDALAITSSNGVDEASYVSINGADQWITIRGKDRTNPVILVVHGGPGNAQSPFAASFLAYEGDYTIVQWDQPGAARTFTRNGGTLTPDLTLAHIVTDGIAVADYLRAHMQTSKIIVLGWSWGSVVGAEMVRARPDLFAAFVGTGQIVAMQAGELLAYERVLAKARERANDEAIQELVTVGSPPYSTFSQFVVQRKWASRFAGTAPSSIILDLLFPPRYSLSDAGGYMRGLLASRDHFIGDRMQGEMFRIDLRGVLDYPVPFFVIEGTEDDITPAALSRAYVDVITAPQKVFIPIEGAGHSAVTEQPLEFLAALNQHVGPIVGAISRR
jgi:pimeloyl-ACP methyl ester carboxylesterase